MVDFHNECGQYGETKQPEFKVTANLHRVTRRLFLV